MSGEFKESNFHPKPEPSQDERIRSELRKRDAHAVKGEIRAEKTREFKSELAERIELAKTFEPGEIVLNHGRKGTVEKPDLLDLKKGKVRVRFGRSEAVACSPKELEKEAKR